MEGRGPGAWAGIVGPAFERSRHDAMGAPLRGTFSKYAILPSGSTEMRERRARTVAHEPLAPGCVAGRRSHLPGFEEHLEGFREHLEGFEEHLEGFEEHLEGFREHLEGFEEHLESFREHLEGFREHSPSILPREGGISSRGAGSRPARESTARLARRVLGRCQVGGRAVRGAGACDRCRRQNARRAAERGHGLVEGPPHPVEQEFEAAAVAGDALRAVLPPEGSDERRMLEMHFVERVPLTEVAAAMGVDDSGYRTFVRRFHELLASLRDGLYRRGIMEIPAWREDLSGHALRDGG
jgi:hypothetical protein